MFVLAGDVDNSSTAPDIVIQVYDMGGQLQFHALGDIFMRNKFVVCLFFNAHHLHLELQGEHPPDYYTTNGTSALETLQGWMDSVVATTTDGAVMLMGTHVDQLSDTAIHDLSAFLRRHLAKQQHPIRRRIIECKDGSHA
jgi:hypothetical protein